MRSARMMVIAGFALAGSLEAQDTGSRVPPTADSTRRCEPSRDPRRLPAVDQVIDSAASTRALAAIVGRPIELLVSVVFGQSGGLAHVAVLWRNTDVDTATAMGTVLIQAARPQNPRTPREDPWGVRVRIQTASAVAFSIERAEYCPPQYLPGQAFTTGRVLLDAQEASEFLRDGRAVARVLVGTDGLIQDVELVNSSGSAEFDRDFVEGARQSRYKPALIDGHPVPVWVERRMELRRRP